MSFEIRGHTFSFGWIIALLVLIACFVIWLAGAHLTVPITLALIAALALAMLVG